jgi:murein DD-endopeptidase MepM/ murein hydrolase activator NlpD
MTEFTMKRLLITVFLIIAAALLSFLILVYNQPFICPIEYEGDWIIRSDSRGDGLFAAPRNGRRLHEGIDLYAPVGAPVYASKSGVVAAARYTRGMGNYVVIRHSRSVKTVYGHLSRIDVKKGQLVLRGRIIGAVGKTGNANNRQIQPHLHFELLQDGVAVDPNLYLK